ncbi:hypothetical protein MLD38_017896 [Melastoma candidum]|uniref:Uncharacterized protein n=1 Tax=Melastoma candidum TaxID=119954 RepID=A0ACB9QS48_9MYRT|nr:hypothetical protein MLD38_017896 [Melastoma candidum]
MQIHLLFFCFIGFILVLPINKAYATYEGELSALLSLKSSLIDTSGFLSDWENTGVGVENGTSHCNWTSVSCNSAGFVDKLDLSNMNLSGRIPETIQDLHSLTSLNFSCNAFTTPLPNSISNLTLLKSIDVSLNNFIGSFPGGLGKSEGLVFINASSNSFSGDIPEDLGNLTKLEVIDLRGNFFVGSIPVSFKNLQSLKYLGLSGNNLTGKILQEIGQMSSLETIILGYNGFEGGIPPEFGNLTNLQYLDLAVGTLSGSIPPEIGQLQKLTTVYMYSNNLEGNIPQEIGNLSSLIFLDLSDNQISGTIPEELSRLKNLQLLNLMSNQLTGPIPDKLQELANLQVLELWQNKLNGTLPPNLGKNSPLQWLDVSSNNLSGEIPPTLCNKGNLTKLILFNNSFSGIIPDGIARCKSLVRVRMQHNLLSGTVTVGFGSLPVLQRLELAYNNISGEIPQDLALSTSLSFIDLSFNHIESSIPSTIFSIPNLQIFIASGNNLQDNIPNQFQDCPSLSVFDLSTNRFSGNIPKSIASCKRLVKLILRNNHLTGDIPAAIATMPTLAILDLSNNSLTGQIPVNFGSSSALELLNVSYNRLEGPIPSGGMFVNINPSDLAGNAGLCSGVLPPCSRKFGASSSSKRTMHVYHIFIGFAIGTSVILTLGIAFFVGRFLYRRWYLYDNFVYDWFKKSKTEWPWRFVPFQRVTFSSADLIACIEEPNVIGMGGTGVVYKAEVHRPHAIVAIKKLWRSESDFHNRDELLREVDLLGRLRHRNILRLLGYLHNESDVMVVYEYMPNGNLATAIHGDAAGKLLVDWVSRYNVAVGVAQGLNYLHNDCHPPVIHRDIKSNNILLDGNMEARIADFGLAKLMIHRNETVSMVAGSYGYIAPEYGFTLKVDEKSDVYSYGVVLLELVTGRTPLDPSFGESVDIVEWVRSKARDNGAAAAARVLDPSIAGQCKDVQEEMLLVLRVALLCTATMPKERPSMRDVLTMLGEAKPRRKSVCYNQVLDASRDKPVFTTSPTVGLL